MTHKIVFLDRESLDATVREFNFPHAYTEYESTWTPDEILTIERALIAYTAGVAEQAFAEGVWGRLVPGASADLLWLDRDPRETPALELPAIGIRGTYVRGKLGYRGEQGQKE